MLCSDLGTQVILDQNQDYNDFDKAIKLASTLQTVDETKTTATITTTTSADSTMTNTIPSSQRTVSLVALGAFGGRFDQEMSSIHALHKWKGTFDRIILLDKENAAFLLEGDDTHTTTHQVQCIDGIEGPTCGLLPLAGAANHVWTEGLHWNLNGDRLKMGELVSSSNYIEQSATIESQTSSQFESQSETKSETQSDSQMTKHARIDKDILTTHDTERVTVTTSADLVWVWNIKWPPIHT